MKTLLEQLEDLTDEQIIEIHNQYCNNIEDYDSKIYEMSEFDDLFSSCTPTEVLDSVDSNFNSNDKYFQYNETLYTSFNYPENNEHIFLDDIVDNIEDIPEDYDLEEYDIELPNCERIIELPLFGGFYNSIEEAVMDNAVEMNNDYLRNELSKSEEYIENVEYDYEEYRKRYVDFVTPAVIDIIKSYIDEDAELIDYHLQSPKYYNYSTDKIITNIKISDIKVVNIFKAHKEEVQKILTERYISHDGYWSFISNDIKKWYEKIKTDDMYISEAIKIILDLEDYKDKAEKDLMNEKDLSFDNIINVIEPKEETKQETKKK